MAALASQHLTAYRVIVRRIKFSNSNIGDIVRERWLWAATQTMSMLQLRNESRVVFSDNSNII
jgi:hypothetical protein